MRSTESGDAAVATRMTAPAADLHFDDRRIAIAECERRFCAFHWRTAGRTSKSASSAGPTAGKPETARRSRGDIRADRGDRSPVGANSPSRAGSSRVVASSTEQLVVAFRLDLIAEENDQPAAATDKPVQAAGFVLAEAADVAQHDAIELRQVAFHEPAFRRFADFDRSGRLRLRRRASARCFVSAGRPPTHSTRIASRTGTLSQRRLSSAGRRRPDGPRRCARRAASNRCVTATVVGLPAGNRPARRRSAGHRPESSTGCRERLLAGNSSEYRA